MYDTNIYFKVVEEEIQALECIPKLGRDSSHTGSGARSATPERLENRGREKEG
jgi:hypothetical protein